MSTAADADDAGDTPDSGSGDGHAGGGGRRGRVVAVLRWVALAVAVVFMAAAFKSTARRLHGQVFPGSARLLVAVALLTANVPLTGWAWAALMGGDRRRRRALTRGFYVSLLGKYVPGGVWQAVGQVGAARQSGFTLAEATAGFTAFALIQLVGGMVLAAGLAVAGGGVHTAYRWLALLGLLGVVVLDRRWMAWAVRRVPVRGDRQIDERVVPAQGAILRAALLNAVGTALGGAAYAVLLGGLPGRAPLLAVTFAWCGSWAVGFATVVFPAGLGAREAVLVAVLAGVATTPAVLATSVYQRLGGMVAEVIVLVGHRLVARLAVRRLARPGP